MVWIECEDGNYIQSWFIDSLHIEWSTHYEYMGQQLTKPTGDAIVAIADDKRYRILSHIADSDKARNICRRIVEAIIRTNSTQSDSDEFVTQKEMRTMLGGDNDKS